MPPTKTKFTRDLKRTDKKDTVGVYLRLKPLESELPVLSKISDQEVQTNSSNDPNPKVYAFTKVFDNATQSEIFNEVARPVVEDFIKQAKDGLIFTYGISGSGKTFTMEGRKSDPGLIYRTIDFIFNSIAVQQTQQSVIQSNRHDNTYSVKNETHYYPTLSRPQPTSVTPSVVRWQNRAKESTNVSVDPYKYYCLFISLIELYNKQAIDLFDEDVDKRRKKIRTDASNMNYVAEAIEIEVKSADEAVEHYMRGVKRRKTCATALNQESSRGHLILNLKLVQIEKVKFNDKWDEKTLEVSQLSLVDLAGCERTKRSGAKGGALHEASHINNSLLALRQCIRALRDRSSVNNNVHIFRDHSLTWLFRSYFQGRGNVRMVLCVNPTQVDLDENLDAMEFGVQSQDVMTDHASPVKKMRTRMEDNKYALMYEYLDKKFLIQEPSSTLSDEAFLENWIHSLKAKSDERKKLIKMAKACQVETRENIVKMEEENGSLKIEYQQKAQALKNGQEEMKMLKSRVGSLERSQTDLKRRNETLEQVKTTQSKDIQRLLKNLNYLQNHFETYKSDNQKLRAGLATAISSQEDTKRELRKSFLPLLERPVGWFNSAAPSAPEMEPMQSSSPVQMTNPSPSLDAQGSSSPPPTTTNSSTDVIDPCHNERARADLSPSTLRRDLLVSPTSFAGVPVINPRHNRSLSCSNIKWIHHQPKGTLDTGTVLKAEIKNGKSVKNLKSSHILHKDAAGYSVVHQDADSNGEIETSVYKGDIVPTVCGGKQVIIHDIETMKQASPKRRRRAASDAHFTH